VDREAKAVFTNWFSHQAAEPWRDPDARGDEAMLSKLRSYALRFALILHCTDSVMSGTSELEPITADQMRRALAVTDTFTEHHRQCRRFYAPKEEDSLAVDLDPIQKRVMAAIVSLEGEIKGGMIPTARTTEAVNNGQHERFHVSGKKVGKFLAGMGLQTKHLPDKSARGAVVEPSVLTRFSNLLGGLNVPNVPNQSEKPLHGQPASVQETSANVRENVSSGYRDVTPDVSGRLQRTRKPAWHKGYGHVGRFLHREDLLLRL